MRLQRVYARDFGRIAEVEVPLGPGLNVLHGPNDLGKSSLVEAIRLALLLPFSSSVAKPWAPWSGAGGRPTVELDFQVGRDHWRVRKEFGSRGKALLSWSKDGVDWDVQEQARGVDGRLRQILQWGIPEPGGSGGPRGLPSSFLATALLSTQREVDAVLRATVDADGDATARDRIAEALSALAEDPLFASILEDVQAKRDEAFTPTGNLRRARDSALVRLGDRVRALREARDAEQQRVADSAGVEAALAELIGQRAGRQQALDAAIEAAERAEACVAAERARAEAAAAVGAAEREVAAIDALAQEVARLEAAVADRRAAAAAAKQALGEARGRREATRSAMEAVEARLRAAADTSDALARQAAELRQAQARGAVERAQAQVAAAQRGGALEAAVAAASAELDAARGQATAADAAAEAADRAASEAAAALGQLAQVERRLDRLDAEAALDRALEAAARREALQAEGEAASAALAAAIDARAAVVAPDAEVLRELRALERDRQVARATLSVGLRVTVTPRWPLELGVVADGEARPPVRLAEVTTVTAEREVSLDLGAVTVDVAGGAADAVARAAELDARWAAEAVPHLDAAGVADLEGLEARRQRAAQLDMEVAAQRDAVARITRDLASFAEVDVAAARSAVDAIWVDGTTPLPDLGPDPRSAVARQRRDAAALQQRHAHAAAARRTEAATLRERVAGKEAALERARAQRAEAGEGPSAADAAAALEAARGALAGVDAELAALAGEEAARRAAEGAELEGARAALQDTELALAAADTAHTEAVRAEAEAVGRHAAAARDLAARDRDAAHAAVAQAAARLAGLPAPARQVGAEELDAVERARDRAQQAVDETERAILQSQGALAQVGGSIARERLAEAEEALARAEQDEAELEAEFRGWKLLHDTLKAADADRSSHLGQALGPAVSARFAQLTDRRYAKLELDAALGTTGVRVGPHLRSADQLSVGTREQLATLYRLALARQLDTVLVLDDQLVQSDGLRMDWFRQLLWDEAADVQVVVLTCRPLDYLPAEGWQGEAVVEVREGVHSRDMGRLVRG